MSQSFTVLRSATWSGAHGDHPIWRLQVPVATPRPDAYPAPYGPTGSYDGLVSYRADDLVKGWVQRSYLKRDGWWAQLVLDEFDFLRGLGFSLTGSDMAGVQFHQKGHFVCFQRSDRDVVVEYDPETDTIGAVVIEHGGPRFIPLDDLILLHIPGAQRLPARSPLDRATIEENVRWWAAGLQQVASDVL